MTAQPTPAPLSESDPYLADAIARAEWGRAMLERLAVLGMEMAEEVREHHKMADLHPEPRHDLRKGYDLMARSVRLTLALIHKFDADIVAMRKGEVPVAPVWAAWGTYPATAPALLEVALKPAPPAATPPDGDAPDVQQPESETERLGEREFERFHRRLIAGEDFQALIEGDFAACVDEIRAGLGLPPLHGEGRLGEAGRGGEVGVRTEGGGDPYSPTPDFALLRLDPPHKGEGGPAPPRGPPLARFRSAGS